MLATSLRELHGFTVLPIRVMLAVLYLQNVCSSTLLINFAMFVLQWRCAAAPEVQNFLLEVINVMLISGICLKTVVRTAPQGLCAVA